MTTDERTVTQRLNESLDSYLKVTGGGVNEFDDGGDIKRPPFAGTQPAGKSFAQAKGGYSTDARQGIKVHYGAHGEVYELAAGAKMAHAIPCKETPEISLDRWLGATMLGDRCEDKTALNFVRESKDFSTGISGGAQGILLPETFQAQWVDNLRSFMVLEAAGMTTATMTSRSVTGSRLLADPGVAWRSEGKGLVVGEPTFELQQLVANTLAVRCQATAELAQDSPDFGSQLLNVMGRALAQEIDRVGLFGTGLSNQPTGIHNTAGIQTVAAVGTPADYSPFVSGLQKLLEANVPLERAEKNAVMSPRTWGTLESLQATDDQPLMRPRALDRMVFRPTTSVPNNLGEGEDESLVMMGDFSDLVLGIRMEAAVEALRLQTYASNLQLEFVGWTRVDFLVRRPASFVELQGVTIGG
tara:strand:+ start:1942 stop:3183 length:1242 start_codon:yes stop_codon:yes gene_type:complete